MTPHVFLGFLMISGSGKSWRFDIWACEYMPEPKAVLMHMILHYTA